MNFFHVVLMSFWWTFESQLKIHQKFIKNHQKFIKNQQTFIKHQQKSVNIQIKSGWPALGLNVLELTCLTCECTWGVVLGLTCVTCDCTWRVVLELTCALHEHRLGLTCGSLTCYCTWKLLPEPACSLPARSDVLEFVCVLVLVPFAIVHVMSLE